MIKFVVNEIQFYNYSACTSQFLIRRTAFQVFNDRHLFKTSVKAYRSDVYIITDKLYNKEFLVSLFHTHFSFSCQFAGNEKHRCEVFYE